MTQYPRTPLTETFLVTYVIEGQPEDFVALPSFDAVLKHIRGDWEWDQALGFTAENILTTWPSKFTEGMIIDQGVGADGKKCHWVVTKQRAATAKGISPLT